MLYTSFTLKTILLFNTILYKKLRININKLNQWHWFCLASIIVLLLHVYIHLTG